MLTEESSPTSPPTARVNVADRLATHADDRPESVAVVEHRVGRTNQRQITFAQLDRDATTLARGLAAMGVRPGHRIALLVKPGVEFVTLVFALLRSGATMVLVDGGLGRKNIVRCLESTNPDGFVAIPQGHALRVLMRKKFPQARFNVTVGRRWFWGGETLESLQKHGEPPASAWGVFAGSAPPADAGGSGGGRSREQLPTSDLQLPTTTANDPAAIVFTSGSTGPPKGVVYRHETFTTQCDEIQRQYDLRPGAVDLACFPLFGLFNVACGITTVLPEMDFSRPASCDPKKLFAAANEWKVTQSFASPAVWDKLSRHADQTVEKIPTLQKVFSCGAPVPAKVIRRTLAMVHPDAQLHTPYGATESLPVATIEAKEILTETAAKTNEGAGVCVGRKFDSIEWRIIKITDDPIATIDLAEELPIGEIGELIVRGPQVSREYLEGGRRKAEGGFSEPQASAPGGTPHNQLAKIADDPLSGNGGIWHRLGDVGYLDDQGRFWYCGRKSQRVVTSEGTLYTECVEGVINQHPYVRRSALAGVGREEDVIACIFFEPDTSEYESIEQDQVHVEDLIQKVVRHISKAFPETTFAGVWAPPQGLPTDIRHNSKIRREELAVWAEKQLKKKRQP